MQLVGCHPHPEQAKELLRKLEGCLLLQLLQGCLVKLQEELDELLEGELGRPGQALLKGSEVGPGDFVSARGCHCFEQRQPRCMPSSLLRQYG